jgi:hypothetical protein
MKLTVKEFISTLFIAIIYLIAKQFITDVIDYLYTNVFSNEVKLIIVLLHILILGIYYCYLKT